MNKRAKLGLLGIAGVPLSLFGASLAFAQTATTTAPNTGAGGAAPMNEILLTISAAVFVVGALYLLRARKAA